MADEGIRSQLQSVLVMLDGRSRLSILGSQSGQHKPCFGRSRISLDCQSELVFGLLNILRSSRAFRAALRGNAAGSPPHAKDPRGQKRKWEEHEFDYMRECLGALPAKKDQNKNLIAICPIRPGRAELMIPNDEGPDVMLPLGS